MPLGDIGCMLTQPRRLPRLPAVKTIGTAVGHRPVKSRLAFATATVLATVSLAGICAEAQATTAAPGFVQPFAGTPKYQKYAPRQATTRRQVNQPLGSKATKRIARHLKLDRRRVFTAKQYALFVSGKGVGGDPDAAKLVDQSVRILTNTTGTPLYAKSVLASYGVFVNSAHLLESPANTDAPTRKVNKVIAPGGYFPTWSRHNGAQASLRMLYRSAYTSEVIFGTKAQQQSGVAQLVTNRKCGRTSIVGMSMAPSIWIVNFALLYTLNPKLAAKMPAYWTPIPSNVAHAIKASATGQVPYSRYRSSFPGARPASQRCDQFTG
jgi:hypothetical protein